MKHPPQEGKAGARLMEYRREIDGLRSIAVIPVILFHAGFPLFSGGYAGVDVFFVISGYLITSILIKDFEGGSFSILKFYERRARRILPALFFVMLCCVPFAYLWMLPAQLKDFSQAFIAIAFFSSNILFWQKSDYFSSAAEANPLLHTWSLGLEEQFYIFFPILLMILWRFGKNPVFYTVIILSFISFLLSEWGWRNLPTANFYLLPTRAWELGAGAICAFTLSGRKPGASSTLSLLGLLLILYSFFAFDESTPFPSYYTLFPVFGAMLVILFGGKSSLSAKILSNKVLVGIGLISFSAYLWHQPLFAFARIRSASEPSDSLMLLLSISSLGLAVLSWRFIEQPFREKRFTHFRSRKQIFNYSLFGTVVLISAGLYGYIKDGLPYREAPSGSIFSELKIDEVLEANYGLSQACDGSFTTSLKCRTGDSPEIMLWGDSFAMHLMQAIQSSENLIGTEVIQFTKSACSPLIDIALTDHKRNESWSRECIDFNSSVMEWLENNDSVEYVVMSSIMVIINSYTYDASGKMNAPSAKLVAQKLNETASYIRKLGKKPVFVSPPPRDGADLARCVIHSLVFEEGGDINCTLSLLETSAEHNAVISFLVDEELNIPVVMLSDHLCDETVCKLFVNGAGVFRDSGHLSRMGSHLLGIKTALGTDIIHAANR